MKSTKAIVLVLFLAVTGYGYAAGGDHTKTAAYMAEQGSCTARADCCKPGAECCKPGAECCETEMSCCEKDKHCCSGEKSCSSKTGTAMAGCCENCPSFCTADAGKTTARQDAKSCCGSLCTGKVAAKK